MSRAGGEPSFAASVHARDRDGREGGWMDG